jgi:integrase
MPRKIPYLQRRGDSFSFRIAVPKDLHKSIGTRELTKALSTQDRCTAIPIALSLAAKAKQLFINLRDMTNQKSPTNGFDLILEVSFDELGLPDGFKINSEPHESDAANSAIRATIEAAALAKERRIHADTAATPLKQLKIASKLTLKTAIDKFLDDPERNKTPDMLTKQRRALNKLLESIGDKPVDELCQLDIKNFFKSLSSYSKATFRDTYKAGLRSFLNDAKAEYEAMGFPQNLTLEGIKYEGDRIKPENKQRPLLQHELKRLFEGAEMKVFSENYAQAHFFWLLHIGLFTGARVNEICQLNPQTDILLDTDSGVWYLWITEETESGDGIIKSVKGGESKKVPIHNKLIELGFLAYVCRVKSEGAKTIFPKWESKGKVTGGRASGRAEKWVYELFRDIGLKDETQGACLSGMHAFRHTLLSCGANKKPPLNLTCITDHAQGANPINATGAAKGYLSTVPKIPLVEKAALLNQLDYGLNFFTPTTT